MQNFLEDWSNVVLLCSVTIYLWDSYLAHRQHSKLLEDKLPAALKGVVAKTEFLKARDYGNRQTQPLGLDKSNFSFINELISQLKMAAVVKLGFLPWAWSAAALLLKLAKFTSQVFCLYFQIQKLCNQMLF